jgi:WD40 repeat protein
VIPGYEIEDVLGRGGMGVVYRARQTQLNRVVALKMLLAGDQAGPDELDRFRAEARTVAQFQHPHIVQIFEVGEHDGRPFFSLEYVEGGSLAQQLRGTPLPARDAAELVETLAGAVHYAHERHLIHRDLKPANILLVPSPGGQLSPGLKGLGTPKVADFGLAKRLDGEGALTQTGAIVGTPSYMAPEQAAGRADQLGPRVDVYALGAILYECLTGRAPFRGATKLETLEQVRTREPVPVRTLNPAVPRDLETVCLKCLHKEPARRYATAVELAEDLRRFLSGEPVRARPVRVLERAWVWAKRRPMAATALGLAMLTVAFGAGSGLAWWLYQVAEAGRETAVQARKQEAALRQDADRLREKAEQAQKQADQARQQADQARDRLDQILDLQRVQGAVREWQASNVVRARELLAECPAERRNWEWHYVRRLVYPLREIPGILGGVYHLQYTADGKRVISSGLTDGLRVWDMATGQDLFYLEGTQPKADKLGGFKSAGANPVGFAVYTGAGEILASFRGAGPLLAWDLATGKKQRQLAATAGQLKTCLAIDPKGTWLAFGSGGGNVFATQIVVVDPASGKQLTQLQGHPTPVLSVAASADGTLLASGCESGVVIIWDMKERKAIRKFAAGAAVVGVAFRPGSDDVVAISRNGVLHSWSVGNDTPRYSVSVRPQQLTALALRPDGLRLACGTDRGDIHTYDAVTGEPREVYRGHLEPYRTVTALAYSPDGKRLLSAGADSTLRIWDATRGPEAGHLEFPLARGSALALHPRTGSLIAASHDGSVRRWLLATGQPVGQYRGHSVAVAHLAAADHAGRVALADMEWTLRIWDWQADKQVLELVRVADRVQTLALSPDGKWLVVSGGGGQGNWLRCWDVDAGKEVPLPQPRLQVGQLSFAPDGRSLALGDFEGNLVVWRFPAGQELFRYQGATSLSALAFSHDGKLLAAGIGGRVRVWRTDGWQDVLDGRVRGKVDLVAWHPTGQRLATASNEVTLWDISTGQLALSLPGSTPQIALRFAADGGVLLGATLDGAVMVWEGPGTLP